MLEVGWRSDHGAIYSPPRALSLNLRLVAACEPLEPDLTAGTRHLIC